MKKLITIEFIGTCNNQYDFLVGSRVYIDKIKIGSRVFIETSDGNNYNGQSVRVIDIKNIEDYELNPTISYKTLTKIDNIPFEVGETIYTNWLNVPLISYNEYKIKCAYPASTGIYDIENQEYSYNLIPDKYLYREKPIPYIEVQFPNKDTVYRFKCTPMVYDQIEHFGLQCFYMINEKDYDYKSQQVKLVKHFIADGEMPNARPHKITNIKWDESFKEDLFDKECDMGWCDNKIATNYYDNLSVIRADTAVDIENLKVKLQECSSKLTNLSTGAMNLAIDNFKDLKNSCEKEDKSMNIFGKNVEFGKYTANDIKMSIKGLAYKTTDNSFVTYDAESHDMTDVSDFILDFDARKFLYKMPVAISDIKIGDIILHNGKPAFVTEEPVGNEIVIMYPIAKEIKHIMAPRNVFGFNYITKVVDFTNGMFAAGANATSDSPFGNNLLPLIIMSENGNMDSMLPLFMMANGNIDQNTLMMFALMGEGNSNIDNMLPLLFVMGNENFTNIINGKKDK